MIRLLKVSPEDACELLRIYSPYVEKTAVSFETEVPGEEEFRQRILQIEKRYPYLKAVDEKGCIAGYAYASTFKDRKAYDWSVETTVYIDQKLRRKGIGTLLYSELEKELKTRGILNMNACIALPKGNDPYLTDDSRAFHLKYGFSMVGVFHDSGFKFGRWYDMCWMEKIIGVHKDCPVPIGH